MAQADLTNELTALREAYPLLDWSLADWTQLSEARQLYQSKATSAAQPRPSTARPCSAKARPSGFALGQGAARDPRDKVPMVTSARSAGGTPRGRLHLGQPGRAKFVSPRAETAERDALVHYKSRPLARSAGSVPQVGRVQFVPATGPPPARGMSAGTRRSPGFHPVGYKMLSGHSSAPAYTMRGHLALSANTDALIPDTTPGPGAYNTHEAALVSRRRGPAYSIVGRNRLSADVDPLAADAGGPGPGQYNTDKY